MLSFALNAQRAAVLEFKANVGVSQNDVDGISAIFITYFQPAGYTMVERTQIDKVIDEQGFQRGELTESQMVKIGKILNVSKIIVGDVNVVMGQYNVDVRAINVETGTISATEGATFTDSYRSSMRTLAQNLATKIAVTNGSIVNPSLPQQPSNTVITLYGYLHVFPNDIGTFDSAPQNIIDKINEGEQYDYCTWRIPTKEELSLLQSNNIITSGETYISSNGSIAGKVRLVTDNTKCSQIKAIEKEKQKLAAEREQIKTEQYLMMKSKGVINGKFSINEDDTIWFSKGNLQYNTSSDTWSFAENQWDYNISSINNTMIDLYHWGTGNNPTKKSNNYNDYLCFYDWGNNTISNGGSYKWRTLTIREWNYILFSRKTNSGTRVVKAQVNGVCGIILFPDNWDNSMYKLYHKNDLKQPYYDNKISRKNWFEIFEVNGAIFLPATETDKYDGDTGRYWSSTPHEWGGAYMIGFSNRDYSGSYIGDDYPKDRSISVEKGRSVRLVCPIE